MIRISIRPTAQARRIAEWLSGTALVFLAALSLAAAVEHIRLASGSVAVAARPNQHGTQAAAAGPALFVHPIPTPAASVPPAVTADLNPAPPPAAAAPPAPPSGRIAGESHAAPELQTRPEQSHPATLPETKAPEPPQMARIVPVIRDTSSGEADRNIPEPGFTTVTGGRRDVPMLRDDAALETWGGEFAGGDSRLTEMIQAGALTSVKKGTQVKVLEVRGPLAHIEVVGQSRTGWIRSNCIGR